MSVLIKNPLFFGGASNVSSKYVPIDQNTEQTYNASSDNLDGYSEINIYTNVRPSVTTKYIYSNGAYNARQDDNVDGYDSVYTNISASTTDLTNLNITSAGQYTYNASTAGYDGYRQVRGSINIPMSISKDENNYSTYSGNLLLNLDPTLTSFSIPSGITKIGQGSCGARPLLTSIDIPNTIVSIGPEAFSRCSGYTTLTIPSSVTAIGSSAFSGGNSWEGYRATLSSVTLDCPINGYDSLGSGIFYGQSVLTTLSLGEHFNVPSQTLDNPYRNPFISYFGFQPSTLTSISVDINNPNFDSRDNCNAVIYTPSDQARNELVLGCVNTTVPNGITAIAPYAFYGSNITSVTLPNTVTSIKYNAFTGCDDLTSITLPNSLTSIEDSAFSQCENLTSITLPNSLTSIGDSTFYNCFALSGTITIPSSIDTIPRGCFANCQNADFTYSQNVKFIGDMAFTGCHSLTTAYIPNDPSYMTSIGDETFYECRSLTSITIPSNITYIGSNAFNGCSSLTSLNIPSNITNIGYNAFVGCTGLTSVTVDSNNSVYDSRDNCNAIIKTSSNELILGCVNTTIPSTVTKIGDCAFQGSGITSMNNIPANITEIGNYAFRDTALTSITIPSTVITCQEDCLMGCSDLTSLTAPAEIAPTILSRAGVNNPCDVIINSGTTLQNEAFEYTGAVKSVTVGGDVTSIGYRTFYQCSNLTDIVLSAKIDHIDSEVAFGCSSLRNITILNPDLGTGSATIGGYLCSYCANIQNITSNDTVASTILYNSESSSVHVNIIDGINTIQQGIFNQKSRLGSITLPTSIISIEEQAFANCPNITNFTYNGTMNDWNNISLGADWNYNSSITVVHCSDGDITL